MRRTKQLGEACSKCKRTDVEFHKNTARCKECISADFTAKGRRTKSIGETCPGCMRNDVEFGKSAIHCKDCSSRIAADRYVRVIKSKRMTDEEAAERKRQNNRRYHERLQKPCAAGCGRPTGPNNTHCRRCSYKRSGSVAADGMKQCKTCKQNLPVAMFTKRRRTPDGLCWDCIACDNNRQNAWNRSRGGFDSLLRTKYGITVEQWLDLHDAQAGGCGACRTPIRMRAMDGCTLWIGEGAEPSVDHDHSTGAVRGLLCAPCNLALSKHMTPAALRGCADYLERWENRKDPRPIEAAGMDTPQNQY